MKFNILLATFTGAVLFVYLVEAAENLCDGSTGTDLLLNCDGCTGIIVCMGSTFITRASCGSMFCNGAVGSGVAECVDEAPAGCGSETTTPVSETTTTTEMITSTSAAATPSSTKEPSSTTAGVVTTTSTVTEVTSTSTMTSTSTDAPTTVSETTTVTEVSTATTPRTTTEASSTTVIASSTTSTTAAGTTSTTTQSTSTRETSTASTTTPLPPVSTILCTGVGIYPDPYNCTRYHYCPANGQTSSEQICPPNYAFHDQAASTTFPCKQILKPANCIVIDCTASTLIYTPYGTSTLYYGYCYADSTTDRGLPTVSMFKCSEGARFDGTTCVFKCPREGLFANTVAPMTYYQCYFSGRSLVYRLMNCPNQMTFNEQLRVCTSGG